MKNVILGLMILSMAVCMVSCGNAGQTDEDYSWDSGSSNSTKNNAIVATVITNDGEQKNMTGADLGKIMDGNAVAFKEKYFGAKVTVVGKVEQVNGRTMYEGHYMESYLELEDGWIVETDPNEVADLLPGDKVKVEGNLYHVDTRVDPCIVEVYRINGHTTKVTKR